MTAALDAMKAAETYAIDKMHSEGAFQVRPGLGSEEAPDHQPICQCLAQLDYSRPLVYCGKSLTMSNSGRKAP
jgi:hypothetical protein